MAYLSFSNVRLSGISVAVPKTISENVDNTTFSSEDVQSFIKTTGIERFRVSDPDVCTSDLAFSAAEKLLCELNWDRNDIELLLFISQGADYILPNTATILQDRLKLPKSCIAFDMTLGCSAYVYGLSVVASMMSTGAIKKALFLCGDTPTKFVNEDDPSTAMLFGDAGSATALEYSLGADDMKFALGTDGSGFRSIIVPAGGARQKIKTMDDVEALQKKKNEDGIVRTDAQLVLDGMNVFSFGITMAPASVRETVDHFKVDINSIDYFVFHQANMMMNKMIRKKLKLPVEKVPFSLKDYGNTSSASIPVTMVTEIRESLTQSENTLLLCGFGVGLSWGSVILNTKNIVVPEIIEI